jgi:predicted RNase H-like HicB family nuclease
MTANGNRAMELPVNIHPEDGTYWADVPELPGCFASGDTLDELFNSAREGIQLYLADESNRETPPLQVRSAALSDASS